MIPQISEGVCASVMEGIARGGIECLKTMAEELPKTQPVLMSCLNEMLTYVIQQHGRVTGEIVLRSCLTLYKLIDTQMEVNDLNERAEL